MRLLLTIYCFHRFTGFGLFAALWVLEFCTVDLNYVYVYVAAMCISVMFGTTVATIIKAAVFWGCCVHGCNDQQCCSYGSNMSFISMLCMTLLYLWNYYCLLDCDWTSVYPYYGNIIILLICYIIFNKNFNKKSIKNINKTLMKMSLKHVAFEKYVSFNGLYFGLFSCCMAELYAVWFLIRKILNKNFDQKYNVNIDDNFMKTFTQLLPFKKYLPFKNLYFNHLWDLSTQNLYYTRLFNKTIYRNIDINYDKLSNKNIDKNYNANFDENVDKFDNGFSKIPYANHSKFKISISSYFESVNCSILNWDKGINKTLDKNFDKNFNRMLVDLIKIFLFCNIPYIDVPNLNSVDENYNMNLNYNKKLKRHNWNFHPKSYKVFNNFKIYLVNHIRTALPGCDNYIYLMKPSLAYYFDIIDTYIIMNLLNLNKIIYNKGFKWSKNAHPWYDRFTFILAHTGHDSCTFILATIQHKPQALSCWYITYILSFVMSLKNTKCKNNQFIVP